MILNVRRLYDDGATTVGVLTVNGIPACYTLEDTRRERKIRHQTRIPEGEYAVTLRTSGGFHTRYANHRNRAIRRIHRGMLWVRDVPGFEFILIHTGNHNGHTSGCLLLADSPPKYVDGRLFAGSSASAYVRVYGVVSKAIASGDKVMIRYTDDSGAYGQSVLA